ncbi:long-chain-fatty-acid--CoA ligase ACSBG2-like [Microcaecilia unicolor]|uniref:Long-chain-fatty-acid--CoA ligase ACSBG2-like n=1 Tax=Microcaecilia unicolor TaxID=1415580 RepID=A0A6P7WQ96_9AMPH|nr:long-chain-fatty-acid--CoA ligase ACSBG2-like [Microcaecilia unicolor]
MAGIPKPHQLEEFLQQPEHVNPLVAEVSGPIHMLLLLLHWLFPSCTCFHVQVFTQTQKLNRACADLIITAGGKNIPPIPIEAAVKEEVPIISNAMLIGDRRKFLSMLLTLKCNFNPDTGEPQDELSPEAVQFCQELGSRATRVSEVISSKDPAVYKAIQEGIERVNGRAESNAHRVQKWTILEKDFSIYGGELGPTMKLKCHVVLQRYQDEIDAFYKL